MYISLQTSQRGYRPELLNRRRYYGGLPLTGNRAIGVFAVQ